MNRRPQIKPNIRNGGTTAPPRTAGGPRTGINANSQRGGIGPGELATGPLGKKGYTPGFGKSPVGENLQPGPKPQGLLPWDAQASNDEAGALKSLGNRVAALDSGYELTQQAYGLEGPWADFKSNPYSQAALLQRSYDNAQRGSVTSFAGQGQLYAGSLVNARTANTRQFDIGRDDLQKRYAEAGAQYQGERAGAFDQFREAQSNAGWNRVQAGIDSEPDTETVVVPGNPGKKKKPPKKKKGR